MDGNGACPMQISSIFFFTLTLILFGLYVLNQIDSEKEKEEMAASSGSRAVVSTLFSVVYVTVPSAEIGKGIARELVNRRLAACVNIVPQLTSIYAWKGKLEEETEAMLIIKTGRERLDALRDAVTKLHPYEVPEFVALPIEYGSEPYLRWLNEQISADPLMEEEKDTKGNKDGEQQ